jgi:hypothetical protein
MTWDIGAFEQASGPIPDPVPQPAPTLAISSLQVAQPKPGKAVISWTTNLAAPGYVRYGLVSPPNQASGITAPVTQYAVALNSLQRHRIYFYQAVVLNADQSAVSSPIGTFTTRW